ncbi:prepilin peptidase [Legionella waltersii]|uniref:Prepilin leader peptidase/N-methyltransferase n=1 Tax=Legionella waltersii TaxID=66969 RepID=A0A0W1A114_9GAMM|nr:A24 family peptidase [Legionella waltersii]KTD75074.1 type 4 (IV) prepilin-like protein leader peptide processing enzyme PilD [Legionella waltersii]SNV05243.1 type 4 (IV) prepilin-like protein leader peptide processing enzyme PilD [Legionella waltersii]
MIETVILSLPTWYLYLCIGIISLVVGSFLNVVIYRLPIMLHDEWKEQAAELFNHDVENGKPKINLFLPRSFCPNCNAKIKSWQNIPILSYLFLKGRCAECKSPIPLRYPMIELLTGLLSLYAAWHFGITLHLLFSLLFIWILIPLIFIDLDHQLLPDSLTLSLLWIGLIANTWGIFTPLPNAVISCAGAYLTLWIFIKLFYLVTGKVGMGHGDFKLFAAFGAWFGWIYLPLILLLSSVSGAIIGIIYLKTQHKSKDTSIPYGPFLSVAGIVSLFWGNTIIYWYLSLFSVA